MTEQQNTQSNSRPDRSRAPIGAKRGVFAQPKARCPRCDLVCHAAYLERAIVCGHCAREVKRAQQNRAATLFAGVKNPHNGEVGR